MNELASILLIFCLENEPQTCHIRPVDISTNIWQCNLVASDFNSTHPELEKGLYTKAVCIEKDQFKWALDETQD